MAHKMNGFTLVEMLVVIAILAIVMGASAPLYQSLNNGSQLDAASNILVQDLYQAQSYARNHADDTSWGVAVNGQIITLFSGTTYATRNAAKDVIYTVPSAISMGGLNQIVFSKLYGLPTTTGSFTFNGGGKTATVTVNGKGMVEY